MLVQLRDSDSQDELGLVEIKNIVGVVNDATKEVSSEQATEEITESWNDFHVQGEHDLDQYDVDDFVTWHNENWVTQIERVYIDLFL